MAGPATQERSRVTVVFHVIFWAAVGLSVLHYTDNWLRFDRYALNPESPVTEPLLIPLTWLIFTAAGAVGYVMFHRERWWPAVGLLAIYSVSGLVGAVHYTDAPPADFDLVQNVLIGTDVLAGIAMIGFAVWLMFRRALPGLAME